VADSRALLDLSVVREYPYPIDVVWEACTSTQALVHWFGREHAPAISFVADIRPGGAWRACLTRGETVRPLYVSGHYLEIDPPNVLVFTFRCEGDHHEDGPGVETEVTMELEALAAHRTRLTIGQIGLRSAESVGGHQHGWESCMDRLGAWLRARYASSTEVGASRVKVRRGQAT
jgi:uncharacterized protein YndB with AHSA1/START domain